MILRKSQSQFSFGTIANTPSTNTTGRRAKRFYSSNAQNLAKNGTNQDVSDLNQMRSSSGGRQKEVQNEGVRGVKMLELKRFQMATDGDVTPAHAVVGKD